MCDKAKRDRLIAAQPIDKTMIPEQQYPKPSPSETGYSFLQSTDKVESELDLRGVTLNFG
ncbi:hypothetical protein FHS77_002698 [Paenochrobactrum gallinarii]|uniref:Uncharacterized protein n=1 Tax=Paenochrobactrum gallinarii TaxID=643673 RepID=A0A841LZ68_9HYPH|nr:hypothetical protein [Paenochrobactrum gallinarii]